MVSATTLSASSLKITNYTIADNSGAGIYVFGYVNANLPITLDNSIVQVTTATAAEQPTSRSAASP